MFIEERILTKEEFLQMVRTVDRERLLVEKGIFSKEEFWEMVNVVNLEIGKMV